MRGRRTTPLPSMPSRERCGSRSSTSRPDGNLIAFKSAKAGTYDIWTVPTAGGEPMQLTAMPGREMAPLSKT